jgi:hypothetical protein
MDRIIKDELILDEKEYWTNMHKMLKDEINSHPGSLTTYTPPQLADALGNIKMRDAMLRAFYDDEQTLNNFFTWWNDCSHWFAGDLDEEQKAKVLPLLAGALLLQGRAEEALEAANLSKQYAKKASVQEPSLSNLIVYALNTTGSMNKTEDAIKLWKESLGAVSMDDIF